MSHDAHAAHDSHDAHASSHSNVPPSSPVTILVAFALGAALTVLSLWTLLAPRA